jgi:hypothetical protein
VTPWPGEDERIAGSNRETVELIGNVAVTRLPRVTRDGLADAGAALPLDEWLHAA